MIESFYPNNIPLFASGSIEFSKTLISIKEQQFQVHLVDGHIIMQAKWLMINIFIWRPLIRRGLPVEKRHMILTGLITPKIIASRMTEIYDDVVSTFHSQGGIPPDEERSILGDLCETINDLHTVVVNQLGSYHLSISAFELADLFLNPEVAKLTELDVSREMLVGITATEDKIRISGEHLVEKLKDKTIPSNVIAPFLELGQLSEKQLVAMFLAVGYRTDVSEDIVRKPILSSYMGGLKDISEYAIESLMGKKTVYYNKQALPDASYDGRKQQLLSSTVRRLYPGDCGSRVTVPFHIHKDNARNTINKNIWDGRIIRLTKDNIGSYVGTTVNLLSPLTCRHTDGMCHVCGGHLTDYIPSKTVVGIACTVEFMSRVKQLVLSAKHYSTTEAIAYVVPEALREVLVIKQNDIYIRDYIDVDKLRIGIQYRDVPYISELKADEASGSTMLISEQQFSSINYMTLARTDSDTILTPEVPMVSDKVVPYLSTEILNHMKNHFRDITTTDDIVWISLKRFDHINEPLLRCSVQSNSMIRFTTELSRLMTRDIRKYTKLGEALRDMSEMVFSEIDTNIFHIETVLKASLITSDVDYNIPVVTDPDNVMFGTLPTIIPRRSLGGLLAYEKLADYMTREPELYLLGHKTGIFDSFFFPSGG